MVWDSSVVSAPHQLYLALATDPTERRSNYRALLAHQLDNDTLDKIRSISNKGLALADNRFKKELERLTGRRMNSKKRGRPTGWRKEKI